ncbi:D-amino-acid oxidase [Spathaspora sp. JA1]|nr:D-amino-acid oxidase [Spathaspora sp. JA1]
MSYNIVILGAGVCGLTTALELKRSNPNANITIVGEFLPGDIDKSYTSPFAGGNWQSFASHEDIELQEIDQVGYKKFLQLAKVDFRAGVWIKNNISYFTNHEVSSKRANFKEFIPWFRNFVDDFEIIDNKDLPEGIAFGTKFKGMVISVPTYLKFLVAQNIEIGNSIRKVTKVKHIEDARKLHSSGKLADFVINATGLSATSIKGIHDRQKNFVVRGQVLLVKNNAKDLLTVEGFPGLENEMLYIMPRVEGGTIIGGCFYANDTNSSEDKELTKRIIKRAIKYAPELIDPKYKGNPSKIDIVKVNVGFRPFREGGARVEADKKYGWLIHNYGAGGGGYQGSYGLAQKVVEVLNAKKSALKPKL